MTKPKPSANRRKSAPETVDPVWIAKALVATVLVALLCGYLTLCLYFYQGQWQLVLHPSPNITATPDSLGLPFEDIHFSDDDAGIPQLTGWYLPGAPTTGAPQPTILYLHSGDGSLSDTLPQLQALHALGFGLFAFDYRGYGRSASIHPNEQRMNEDAEHAFNYLATVRKIPPAEIIPYGVGVGASLAAALAQQHTQIKALILESPQNDLMPTVAQDPRAHLIPLHLLFHNPFPLADCLRTLATPKLLLTDGPTAPPAFRNAADPKITVEFTTSSATEYAQAISRFRGQYLPSTGVPQWMPAQK